MAKGYTRKITRKQALSYERLTPNGMGVTAIAAVNGRRKKKSRKNASRLKSAFRALVTGAPTRRRRRKPALGSPRYTSKGARDELRHLKTQKRFTPSELKTLGRGGRVRRGGSTYYSPYLSGFARSRGRGIVANSEGAACPPPAPAAANRRRKKAPKRGADYRRRYQQTRALLEANVKRNGRGRRRIAGMPIVPIGEEHEWTPHVVRRRRRSSARASTKERPMKRRVKKRRTPAQRAAFKRMLAGLRAYKKKQGGRKRKGRSAAVAPRRRKAARKRYAANRKLNKAGRSAAAKKAARTRKRKHAIRSRAAKKAARTRKSGGRRRARRNVGRRKAPTSTYTKNRKKGYRRVVAKIGGRQVKTYLYKTKRGGTKHIPVYASAGMKTRSALGKAIRAGGKTADRVRRRVAAIRRARERASQRVLLHGDIFTPNKRGTVVPFSTWSKSMKSNRRKKRSASRGSKRSRAAKKAARTRKLKHEVRVRAARKAARTRKRKGGGRKRKTATRRRRKYARRSAAAPKRTRRRRHRRNRSKAVAVYSSNRRRRHSRNRKRRSYASLPAKGPFYANRRRRRRYSRNFKSKDFMGQFTSLLKVGLAVSVGFIAHRAVSKIVAKGLNSAGIGASLGTWNDTVAQLLVAGLGMVGLAKYGGKGKNAQVVNQVNTGVFASFAHALVTMLVQQAAPQYVTYLSGYPDAQGRAYSGYGEYIATNGFGSPMLSQAAAGFGAPMLSQAAAGFGQHPMLSQAAAGYGEYIATSGFGNPMLSQAAAGTGEYIASGVQGIGDYEMVSGVGSSAMGVADDGIRPNLDAAEHALNIAEAAAGIGLGDLPTSSQQYPMMVAKPISDVPSGARAGLFAGKGGIFG